MKVKLLLSVGLTLLVLLLALGVSLAQEPDQQGPGERDRIDSRPAQEGERRPVEQGGAEVGPLGALDITAAVTSTFSYQGVLEEDGNPVTGNRQMIFRLYSDDACTSQVGSPMTYTVAVNEGLFHVDLLVDHADFNGQALWLEPEVDGTPVGCQAIQAVPYALSLRPGAIISGAMPYGQPILDLRNPQWSWGLPSGVRSFSGSGKAGDLHPPFYSAAGEFAGPNGVIGAASDDASDGYGVIGLAQGGWGIGVFGRTVTTTGYATGGYFESNSEYGYGVQGLANNSSGANYGVYGRSYSFDGYGGYFRNSAGPGTWDAGVAVLGLSASGSAEDANPGGWYYDAAGEFVGPNGVIGAASDDAIDGYGVIGFAQGSWGRGVYGSATYTTGTTYGVYGDSASENGFGVYGVTASDDLYAAASVWGDKSSGGGAAVRGNKEGDSGVAVLGTNYGATGTGTGGISTNYYGLWGESTNGTGAYAMTFRGDNNYGLYTPDNLYSNNYNLAGAIMHVVQNGGDEPLEPGDVVVFSGMAAPLEAGGPPVVQVARVTAANSTAVAGVVSSRFNIEVVTGEPEYMDGRGSKAGLEVTPAGPVAPGEYLLLVVQGPAQVRASAVAGAIQPGDLLSSAGEAGCAARAAEVAIEGVKTAMPGTVLGKALEPLDRGQELIYVFVTLQ